MSFRDERLYLTDIIEHTDAVLRHLAHKSANDLKADDVLQYSILMRLIIIGEATAKVSESPRQRHPEIPWNRIVGFRHFAVHTYYAVDWDRVWNATQQLSHLRRALADILTSLP